MLLQQPVFVRIYEPAVPHGACRLALGVDIPAALGVDLELLDQPAEFSRGFHQLLRCLLRVRGPVDVLSRPGPTPLILLVISWLPCAASLTLRAISLVVAFCSSTALRSCWRFRLPD